MKDEEHFCVLIRAAVCFLWRMCTCLSDPEPTAISSSARRFSSSATYRDATQKTWLAVTTRLHPTHTHIHTPFSLCFPSLGIQTFLSWDEKTWQELHTLADSVNFSCSGLLCSSYSTTPSGPLAGAGLPSPGAPPRLPLAASSWVSRRLQATRKSSQKDQRISVFNTVISLR